MSVATHLPRRIEPGAVLEVTDRTAGGQHLFTSALRPDIEASLWHAAQMASVQVFGYVFMSNHYHLLVSAPGPRQFAWFLQLLHTRIAAAVNSGRAARGKVWARRADVVPVSSEPSAQVRRLGYVLANSVKEGAVAHPADWGGPHCAHDFQAADDVPDAALPGSGRFGMEPKKIGNSKKLRHRYTPMPVPNLRPLPHLGHLSRAVWLGDMRRLSDRIAAAPHDRDAWLEPHLIDPSLPRPSAPPRRPPAAVKSATTPVSQSAVPRATEPRVRDRCREPYPVHADDPAVRHLMRNELASFHDAYAAASAALRNGDAGTRFPPHCIKPPQAWPSGATAGRAARCSTSAEAARREPAPREVRAA